MWKALSILIILTIVSCSKDKTTNPLIGSWILVEELNAPGFGTCVCWEKVSADKANKLTFTPFGQHVFTRHPVWGGKCRGKYRLLNDSAITFTYDCASDVNHKFTYQIKISDEEFIIDAGMISNFYLFKYRRL